MQRTDRHPPATPALELLERLPEPQREAIRARMLDELEARQLKEGQIS